MQLNATYRGGDDPFEGDRVVELRALPAGALVQRATLMITPTNAAPAAPRVPFEERFVFGAARPDELAAADWGVFATGVNASVEVDLHARRTLASVAGARIAGSTLTVDVGGLYVELNENGAVRAPGDDAWPMVASGALPGVTVPGFRLTGGAASRPAVDTLVVRSGPSNVTISLGTLGPFWTYVGDLAAPQTTPDFAETLQAFLLEADVRDGAFVIPFAVHADGVARLDLALELEYMHSRSLLPAGLAEAVLPFDLSTFARSGSAALSVRLPAGAEAVPELTRARVNGAFEPTRIAAEAGTGVIPPPAETTIAADRAAAQALEPATGDVVATGLDLYLAPLGPSARLSVTLLADSDGKPFGEPLLRAPLELALTREQGRAAAWTTVSVGEPFHLEQRRRYWLVLQALDGEASWGAAAAGAADVPLQTSADGGRSWSHATDARLPGPLTALHRLRITPDRFTMPIALDIGDQHVTLEEFEPLNRVDFTVDTPKLAQAFDAAVTAAGAHGCPAGEHLANAELDGWVGVGDELDLGTSLTLEGGPRALALAPDGSRAYVAAVAPGDGELRVLLETVPLACGAAVAPIELQRGEVTFDPVLVSLGRAGDRAYVLGELDGEPTLAIADLDAGARVGETIDLHPIIGLAVAPGGERLLLLEQLGGDVVILAADTRAIERVAIDGSGLAGELTEIARVALHGNEQVVPPVPAAFAAAAVGGETLLAFAVEDVGGAAAGASRVVLVTEERPQDVASVTVGRGPLALAATTDGRRIVVACASDQTLSVVTTGAPGGPRATSITLDAAPAAAVLSADGTRAAVLSEDEVAVYDVEALRRLARETIGSGPVALAGSARLDLLLVAQSLAASLARLVTAAVPVDWVLTSGEVEPRCFDGDLGALLGRRRLPPRPRVGRVEPAPRVPSAISQIVAVTGGCRYAFSFWGLADQPASVGEVLWRAGDCGMTRTDRVPIIEFERPAKGRQEAGEPKLVLHRIVVDAPVGASQAEVRFTVPIGGLAAIGSVSLRGSDAVGANEDFQERADGALGGWAADPGGGELSTEVTAGAGGARIANDTAVTGSLVQSFAVAAGQPLVIELAGRVAAVGEDPGPMLELRFADADGTVVGEAVAVPLSRHAFDQVALAADVPAGAARAEVRLQLPPGAALELARVAASRPTDVEVPIVVRAEAPGELAVSSAEVVYDVRRAPTPVLPAEGVCTPTPPGRVPGAEPEAGHCCCADHERHEAKDTILKGMRERLYARGAGLPPERAVATPALTDVPGIGAVRARRLARAGIASAERLAVADPRVVALVLGGGVSNAAAGRIVTGAREVVAPSVE